MGGQHLIRGELWRVDAESLAGLDDYEGVTKGYYARVSVDCRETSRSSRHRTHTVQAQMYGIIATQHLWSDQELHGLQCVPEYTSKMHEALYRPVEHILLKQQLYLSNQRCYNDATVDHALP